MADVSRLYIWHEPEDVILLLASASILARDKPNISFNDIQDNLKVGYQEAVVILDWLADHHKVESKISTHTTRKAIAYVKNTLFPSLEEMQQLLRVGERRAIGIMQKLERKGVIRIKKDFSFERVGRMASFDDLVAQMKVFAKKYRGRCEPQLLKRLMHVDHITAVRLAQYGEEHLGFRWKNRPRELL